MVRLSSARNMRTLGLMAILSLLLGALAGCGGSSSAPANTTPIKIGFTVSLTGDFSADGKAVQQGYQLWADSVNAHGGILGRKVVLDALDDASNPDQVTTDYQKLITVDKVNLTFGPFSTLLTKPASVITHRYGYALPEGSGGGPSVFQQGLNNVFDVSLPVANNLVSFAQWILSLPAGQRPTSVAYATQDDPFTQPQVDLAKQLLEQGGVKTAYYKVYPAETTDFTPIAQGVIASGAQVDVFGTLLPDITAFIQAFKQQHYNPQALIATAGPDQGSQFLKNVGGAQAAEGIFVPNAWYPGLNAPGNQDFVKPTSPSMAVPLTLSARRRRGLFGRTGGRGSRYARTTVWITRKLIQTLHSGTFDSVQGKVKFDSTGQNTPHGISVPMAEGKLQFLCYQHLWPPRQPVFPKPNWP